MYGTASGVLQLVSPWSTLTLPMRFAASIALFRHEGLKTPIEMSAPFIAHDRVRPLAHEHQTTHVVALQRDIHAEDPVRARTQNLCKPFLADHQDPLVVT